MYEELKDILLNIALSDLLLYRSEKESGLRAIQEQKWGKVLYLIKDHYGLDFITTTGVMPIKQPEKLSNKLKKIISLIPEEDVVVLSQIARALGSTILALAVYNKLISKEDAFNYSVIDEVWQNEISGYDPEEVLRRERMFKELIFLISNLSTFKNKENKV